MTDSLFDLTGKTALVTGSSRGIGNSIAEGLLESGASVVIHGRDEQTVAEAASVFSDRFGEDRVFTATFDVTVPDAVETGIARVLEMVGHLDILVNNAGLQHRVPLLDLELENWHRVMDTNVTSAFLVGRTVARSMIERGSGKIINVGSVQVDLARPTIGAYTASKGAVRNLTRAMSAEWAKHGLQINAIAPGYIHTSMTQALVDDEAFNSWIIGRTPAGRWGSPEDLKGPAIWLASAGSNYVNGQTIFIDGGMTTVV